MRAVLAAALLCATTLPAFAQAGPPTVTPEQVEAANTALEEAKLSETAYMHLWCGAAFGIVTDMLTARGDAASAQSAGGFRDALYQKAAAELIEAGVSESDFTSLAEHLHVIAVSQQKTSQDAESIADYTLDECNAAATAP